MGLNCTKYISLDTLRSTLSEYETIWLHGDSVMQQTFYTLACMMHSSVTLPPTNPYPDTKTGLAEQGRLKVRFTYTHANGKTEFLYSRFGLQWGLQDNLYKHDFPYAVKTLSAKDIILTNGGSVHYAAAEGSQMEKALDFILTQSKLANASIYLIEPTPEEWPTTNGMYTTSCNPVFDRCKCEALSDDRIIGYGLFTQPPEHDNGVTMDEQYARGRGKPEFDFFKRLYPNIDPSFISNQSHTCIPNCMPNTWRLDLMRQFLQNTTDMNDDNLHLVSIYWQLVSNPGGHTVRAAKADCTHRNLDVAELMLFQWIRTILERS